MTLTRRLLLVAAGGGSFAPPGEPAAFEVLAAPEGGWPGATSAFYNAATGESLIGFANNTGDISVVAYDHASGGTSVEDIGGPTSVDHHNSPGILRRSSDGRYVAVMASHNSPDIYRRISTNADDMTAWEAVANIDASLGGTAYTYPFLFQLGDETSDPIYLFVRSVDGLTWALASSTDGGSTWGALTSLVSGTRYYARCVKSSESRLDFAVCDGSYAEDFASVYHFYYEGGSFYTTDGVDLGSPPFNVADLSRVYDGASAGARYIADIAKVGTDIVVMFPAQTGTPSGHVGTNSAYKYARWDGSSWTVRTPVAAAGAPSFELPEGGCAVDPSDLDHIAVSALSGGFWSIFDYTTSDDGATWSSTQKTAGETAIYPWFVRDHDDGLEYVWLQGTFNDFDDFNLAIVGYGVPV